MNRFERFLVYYGVTSVLAYWFLLFDSSSLENDGLVMVYSRFTNRLLIVTIVVLIIGYITFFALELIIGKNKLINRGNKVENDELRKSFTKIMIIWLGFVGYLVIFITFKPDLTLFLIDYISLTWFILFVSGGLIFWIGLPFLLFKQYYYTNNFLNLCHNSELYQI